MKTAKYLISLLLLTACLAALAQTVGLNGKISSAEPKQMKFVWVELTSGTSVFGTATNFYFTAATFYGVKQVTNGLAPTANSAVFYVAWRDPSALVITNTPGALDSVAAGASYSLAPIGVKYNLNDIAFLGTTTDRVLIRYQQ